MIYNYLKIAWRNIVKYRFISFINLFGITVGLTCCLLISAYILHELSYDKYHPKGQRVYRITRQFNAPDGKVWLHLGTIAPPFGPLIKNDFGEIEKMTRLLQFGPTATRYGEKTFSENDVFVADDQLFDVFKVGVTKGNPQKALSDPFCIMLSEEKAKKYFGDEDPMNKTIRIFDQYELKITGIYKPFPANSHMHPGMLISFPTLKDSSVYGEENLRTNWGNNSFFTYILLPEHYDYKKMEARFPAFLDKHMSRLNPKATMKPSQTTALFLQKMTDIHLRSHLDYEAEENGDIKRVYIFSAIALFILLIACINYMNLSTARSALRAREIGIRKVVGALRKEIILQFLGESILITSIALVLALGLTWLLLPYLNKLSGQELSLSNLLHWKLILALVLMPFVIGLMSGIYPALFMSSFRPVTVLKGLFKPGSGNLSFRKVLVVVQFAISIILIVATVVVARQMSFIQQKSLGFNRNYIVTVPYNGSLTQQFDAFRNELLRTGTILNTCRSSRIPTTRLLDADNAKIPVGDTVQAVDADVKFVVVDFDFVPTYGMKMAAGRNFSRDFGGDTANFIINEAAVAALGWGSPKNAIGKSFMYGDVKGNIIGVVGDFHFESMHEKITPLIFLLPGQSNAFFGRLSVKFTGKNVQSALSHLETTWKKFLPQAPFEYTFMDENFKRLYQAEERQGTIFTTFSFIAIFIACLGLFGLSAFTITQRIKEIGIRKVLGAGISNIVELLSKDFLKLILIAAIIAFPVAWYGMFKWLQDFAYRINVPWWAFVFAGALAAIIALVTISFLAVKAARSNPVKSLRTE